MNFILNIFQAETISQDTKHLKQFKTSRKLTNNYKSRIIQWML